jgi:hypothetical protein
MEQFMYTCFEENADQRDYNYLKQLYPKEMKNIQQHVERRCRQLDYPFSPMYDEYPDPLMLHMQCKAIKEDCRNDTNKDWIDEAVPVLFYQELMDRRRRWRNCENPNQMIFPYSETNYRDV